MLQAAQGRDQGGRGRLATASVIVRPGHGFSCLDHREFSLLISGVELCGRAHRSCRLCMREIDMAAGGLQQQLQSLDQNMFYLCLHQCLHQSKMPLLIFWV